MRRSLCAGIAVLLLAGVSLGCAKRVPMEVGEFDARQQVVLSFQDGSQIRGKIGIDERVEVTTEGAVYRGMIWELTDTEIVLRDARFIRRAGDHNAGRERMTHARYHLETEPASFTFRREDIAQIEEVRVDALRTASQAFFWAVAGTVSAFLLGEKS